MSATFRLTARQFAALDRTISEQAKTRPVAETSRVIARAVIVDGKSLQEAATEQGRAKQWASYVIKRYHRVWLEQQQEAGLPAQTWSSHDMPSDMIRPLETFLKEVRRAKDPARARTAVSSVIRSLETQTKKLG